MGKSIRTTDDGLPILEKDAGSDTTTEGLPILKKKEGSIGSVSPSGSSPNLGKTALHAGTSGSDLSPEQEKKYNEWKNTLTEDQKNEKDYDLKGFFQKNGPVKLTGGQHLNDEFKRPNHITFSTESEYSKGDAQGGKWAQEGKKWKFYASPYNLTQHSAQEMQSYFKKYEPDSELILPSPSSTNKQLTQNYKNNSLTPKDVSDQPLGQFIGPSPEQISHAINNKGENIKKITKAPTVVNITKAVGEHKDVQDKMTQLSTRQSMVGDVKDYDQQMANLKAQESRIRSSIQKSYDAQKETLVPELVDNLKDNFAGANWNEIYSNEKKDENGISSPVAIDAPLKWDSETNKLTPKSVEYVAKHIDDYMNKKGDDVVNAQVSGDLDKKQRTYFDLTKSVVDELNKVPVRKKQDEFTAEYTAKNPKLKDAIDAQKRANEYFSKENVDAVKAKVNVDRDKEFIKTQERYYGPGGIFQENKDYVGIQEKFAQLVADGKMTEEVAKKQIQAEIKQNPALKKINDNLENEVKKINEQTQTHWQNYLIQGLQKNNPNLTVYKDGTVGVAGLSKDQYTNMMEGYEEGMDNIAKKMVGEQEAATMKKNNERAKSYGAFFGSLTESGNDLAAGFSKFLFNKTQWGGERVRHFEANEIAGPNISQSDVAATWNWKGLESLKDPNFWMSKMGSMVPVIAGAAAVSAATEGEGIPQYVSWLANAGLFTAQGGLETYNQLLNSRDAQGNLLTEADAAHFMARDMEKSILPNVLMMAVTSGTLLKAKNIAKPSLLAAAGKGVAGAAIAQPFFTWQGYESYANMKEALGEKTDIWDYMQSKDFKDNLINGMVVGSGLSLLHAPGNYMKSVDNWTKMVHTSEGEFRNLIPQNYALQQEMSGNGTYLRDALKLHVFNTDPEGLNEAGKKQLSDLKNQLKYSVDLDRNIKAANLDRTNINDLYQAHNLALADQHDFLAEQNKDNKSLSSIYSDKAKEYREQAKSVANGEAKYHYLTNDQGEPIFMSDKSFKTLDENGTIGKWVIDQTIEGVHSSDDPEFAQRYKDHIEAKNESQVEGQSPQEHISSLIKENKDKLGVLYEGAKANPEQFLKDVADQAFGRNADGDPSLRPDAEVEARTQYGDDIVDMAKVLYPEKETPPTPKEATVQSAIIKVGNKIYEGENHGEAIDKAEAAGEDVSGIDREKDGLFKLSDGRIITREEAKKEFGADHSHELIDPGQEYKKNIRDDYFVEKGFLTDEQQVRYDKFQKEGNIEERNKVVDERRAELSMESGNLDKKTENGKADIEKQLPDTLSPEEKRGAIAGGQANAEATVLTGTIHSANEEAKGRGKGLSPRELKGQEEDKLREYAIKNGLLLPAETRPPDASGFEQSIYMNPDGKSVTKVNPNKLHESWNDLFHRIALHNSLFPDTSYTLKGFSEDGDGNLSAVFEQPFVEKGVDPVKYSEVKEELGKMGFEPSTSKDFEKPDAGVYFDNKKTGVRIADITGSNVIKDINGKLRFIDPVITKQDKIISMPKEEENTPNKPPTIPPVIGPSEEGLHPRDNEWTSIQKKDLSERVQKENAFTQTNRATIDNVINRISRDASANGRTWQSQAEFEVNALHNDFFNEDGSIKQAFNPTTDQLALIGIRLMDINGESSVSEFNPNDDQQTARNAYLENEKMKAERLLSFGEAGRAFQFRQSLLKMGINGDIQIKRKAISSMVGVKIPETEEQFNQLSDFDKQRIKPVYDAFQSWKAEYEKENKARTVIDEKYSQEEFDKRIKVAIKDALKEAKVPDKGAKITKESSKKISDSLKTFADKFEKFGRADLPEGTQKAGFGPDIQKKIADAIRWIAEKISNGDIKIPELISEALERFKGKDLSEADLSENIKKGLSEAGVDDKSLNAPTNREGILGKMKEIAKNEGVKSITKDMVDKGLVRDYLHDIAKRGETDPKDILEKGIKELGEAFPSIDAKTLRDAYLKEGVFTPDKSKDLEDQIKKSAQTFHDVTVLQRDIEALEVGKDLYGADKENRSTLISDYEGSLKKQKDQIVKDRDDAIRKNKDEYRKLETERNRQLKVVNDLQEKIKNLRSGIRPDPKNRISKEDTPEIEALKKQKDQADKDLRKVESDQKSLQKKNEKIADYDKRIRDLDNHKKVWDRAKSGNQVDKDLASKREELRKTLIKNGVKLETGSKDARQTKEKVIDAHNERVSNLKGKITDLLNDDTVPDEDKKVLRTVKSSLDKMNVKVDAGELDDKIKKAIAMSGKLHSDNITDLVTGRKAEILKDLKDLSTQLKKDNNYGLQDIQLEQLKRREISRKEQAERDLAAGKFEDIPKLSDYKKDEELLKLSRDRKMAESNLAREVDRYKKQNESFWQRQVTRLKRLQRANLISGIMTNGKVLVATVVKPVSDALVRRTIGTLTTPIFKSLGLKGDRESLNNDATIKSFVDSFKGMTQRQAAEKRGTAETGLENATVSLQAANDQLKALETQHGKDNPEYQQYKDNEYTKAVNDFQAAQYDWAASMMYDFISPRAWAERLNILKTGVSKFEESMGGHKGQTWADEKSQHMAGTVANKIIHSLEIFGRVHGAEKDISARQAFVEGFLKRATERIKAGEQLTPSKLEGIALESYPNFLGGKFQNKNPVSDYIREKQIELEKKGPGGKAVAFGIGATTPVLKVPLNIEAEGLLKYTAGLPIAIYKTFSEIGKALKVNDLTLKDGIKDFNGTMEAIRDHMQQLSPEKRDMILQYANKGIFGAAMALVTGSMAASGNLVFGGAYGPGKKKRKYLDADTGEMEELNYGEIVLNGHKLGKFWSAVVMHLPPLMPAVMSATYIQKYKDERGDFKDEKDKATAAFDGLSEVVRTAWEESALKSLGDITQAPGNIFNSFTTQMAAKNISEYYDTEDGKLVERKAENVWDAILLRTGGRKFVPTKEQALLDKADKIDEGSQKAEDLREGDPYYEKNQK